MEAESLAKEINHYAHPSHPLILEERSRSPCDTCGQKDGRLRYRCHQCKFQLCPRCANTTRTVEHTGHQHPLTIQMKKSRFTCDVCGRSDKERGFSYQCADCHYWAHEKCTQLPGSMEHSSHPHPLSLSGWFRLDLEVFGFYVDCGICGEEVNRRNCVYYCAGCRYFAHVGCAVKTSTTTENKKSDKKGEDCSPNVLCLPAPDESGSIDLVTRHISLLGSNNSESGLKNCHCNRQFTLIDAPTNELCDACVCPISAPYYSCVEECQLILHKSCAELPCEIQHKLHKEHPLALTKNEVFECDACGYLCTGFSFRCAPCSFYIDVKCASLPTTVRHKSHEHVLNLREPLVSRCKACYEEFQFIGFNCTACNFLLHVQCALLPQTLKHKYDSHALVLTYSPVGMPLEEYYCEVCEKEMNLKLWFYYCKDCKRAFHPKCIYKAVDQDGHAKLGAKIVVNTHPHPLILAGKQNRKHSECDHCHRAREKIGFECNECRFYLHVDCAL